ncbi:cytochrome c oxidase subunit 3 [Candidatus Persebacteraceae bacterium Df01]|jgi:cytochrome c oxidase subunit 3|uniref:cytochrome-c oxidase n=1 Tax=Candidatus Doriopsillibacter californiensis TaxID=2970740 RepID=A0ABT7QK21_9GAMM|nr:cytochrome c oxidase subunit 3 [Candidatus Persebacteraceae bacterium Df01]
MSDSSHYFVPANSKWPIYTSLSMFLVVSGFICIFNELSGAYAVFGAGFLALTYCMVGWWRDVTVESEGGKYKEWEDMSFRWSMGWFIFSEVMFFVSFFGALFYARVLAVPDLGGLDSKVIWPQFEAIWPTAGPYFPDNFETIPAFDVPLVNTLILLTSGVTVTWAHWALKLNKRRQLNIGLALTVLLGVIFLAFQVQEYVHAYNDLNLRLDSGIYGSTFFMLTGFHGLHVTIGTISLIVILGRCMAGHFTPDKHFGFEAVAWYWHFVDVVWLFLFIVVYWL